MVKKTCAYPRCTTVLSRYNDGKCCSQHENYNNMVRAGLAYAKVPEALPVKHSKGQKRGKKRAK